MLKLEIVFFFLEGRGQCVIYRYMSIIDFMYFLGVVGMDENVEWG